jgi:hypothetical protein
MLPSSLKAGFGHHPFAGGHRLDWAEFRKLKKGSALPSPLHDCIREPLIRRSSRMQLAAAAESQAAAICPSFEAG